jgi:predicted secreted protein
MSPFTLVAVYLTIWWTVLFCVLPINSQSFIEAGVEPPAGADPSSPVNPNLKRKFFTTTWVSAILWLVIFVVVQFKLIDLSAIPLH